MTSLDEIFRKFFKSKEDALKILEFVNAARERQNPPQKPCTIIERLTITIRYPKGWGHKTIAYKGYPSLNSAICYYKERGYIIIDTEFLGWSIIPPKGKPKTIPYIELHDPFTESEHTGTGIFVPRHSS